MIKAGLDVFRFVGLVVLFGAFFCGGVGRSYGDVGRLPSEFYIVSVVTSDASPFWYRYILHVRADGRDSIVRYIRVAPMDSMCADAITIKAAVARLKGVSPSDLVESYKICEIDSTSLNHDLQRRTHTAAIDDSVRFNIVAQCGSREMLINLPYPEQVNLERIRRLSRSLARWWDLRDSVRERAFGSANVFYEVSDAREEELQREGEVAPSELRSGRFDRGVPPICIPGQPCRSFREVLSGYVGQIGGWGYEPKLVQSGVYRFRRYVPPKYPALAMRGRVSAKVQLELSVDGVTGDVQDIRVVLCHPMFLNSVIQAVRQWRFAEEPVGYLLRVPVDLVFDWHCPEPSARP
jgi:hypothetical protein